MSTTHSVGKQAYVLLDSTGKKWWLLEEQTYESNCFPQTPKWSYGYFGDEAGMLDRIIQNASSCEGGCLSGSKRSLLPESYIRQWEEAIKSPIEATSFGVNFSFGEYLHDIPVSLKDEIIAILTDAGRDLNAGMPAYFKTSKPEELAAIDKITKLNGSYTWRVIRTVNTGYQTVSGAAIESDKKFPAHSMSKMIGDRECYFFQLNDKPFVGSGWQCVGNVMCEIASQGVSLKNAIKIIKEFRAELASAVLYQGEVTIVRKPKTYNDQIDAEIFGDQMTRVINTQEYAELVLKDYFLIEKIDVAALLANAVPILNQESLFT